MSKRIMDPENSLWSWINKIPEMIALSVLWVLLCLPVVTIVPACVALYDAVSRNLRPDEKGVFTRFFRTFKNELARGIVLSILWLAITAFLVWLFMFLKQKAKTGGNWDVYLLVYQVTTLIPLAVFAWLIPLQSRFVYSFGTLHKNALIFAISYLPYTVLILVLLLGVLWLTRLFFPLVLIAPALLVLLQSLPIEKVLKKHMPDTEMENS